MNDLDFFGEFSVFFMAIISIFLLFIGLLYWMFNDKEKSVGKNDY